MASRRIPLFRRCKFLLLFGAFLGGAAAFFVYAFRPRSTILPLVAYYLGVDQEVGGEKGVNTFVRENFQPAGEDSQPDDHPDMVYMRKYGRLFGLPHDDEQLDNMTLKELLYIYHSYLDNTDIVCHRKLRMGQAGDGGWELCDDYAYRPLRPCIVYSFGINDDFSFDDDISKLYGCDVYAFDPSMVDTTHNRSEKVHFYSIGLSGEDQILTPGKSFDRNVKSLREDDENWELRTLSHLKDMLGHTNTSIDVLKMDIEFAEWPSLLDILQHKELDNVRQLLIEYHTKTRPDNVDGADAYRQRLKTLSAIEALGFQRYHTHMNPWGDKAYQEFPDQRTSAYEIYYVNTRLARAQH